MSNDVQNEINIILDECYGEALELIRKRKNQMDGAVEILFKNNKITEEVLIEIMKER